MPAPIPLLVLGVPVDLVVSDGDGDVQLREELAVRWQLCLRTEDPTPTDRPTRTVPVVDPTTHGLAETMVLTTHAVTREAIEGRVGDLLMLHAAGLADPVSGAAVAFVAPGGTGKTTLTRTLGRGRRYLSDETVGVAESREVVAYPKPLSVRRGDQLTKDELDPVALGLSTAGATARLAALVILDRVAEHEGAPEVTELELFDAIIALCPETSSLSRLPSPLHRLERLVEETRPVTRVRYAEARSLEPLVTELIGPPR